MTPPTIPGGLGTVDAALAALRTGFGATSSQALTADLVWRATIWVPQVLLGAGQRRPSPAACHGRTRYPPHEVKMARWVRWTIAAVQDAAPSQEARDGAR